ncbi:WD repeat domain-containing protein [Rutstroemia sp. NJR-2017a WRK4]|nr:WD repeat domain-containing protein [Rutstroemia sp. NJR-2017a WRK4]
MSDAALPKIKVTDAHLDVSKEQQAIDSPTTPEVENSPRPRSATSSEGPKKSQIASIRNGSGKENGSEPTSPPPQQQPSTAIDPLSHHILKRTNTENAISQKLRNAPTSGSGVGDLGSPGSPEIGPPGRQMTPDIIRNDTGLSRDKKKGVSFLNRFNILGGKKKDQVEIEDDESELGDPRTEGMNAHVFSTSIDANGYTPRHKEPPRYIKVRAHNKKATEFNRMFLAQELTGTKPGSQDGKISSPTPSEHPNKLTKPPKSGGAVWAAEFSKDGKYFAAAGKDQVVRVWAVISTPEERQAHEFDEDEEKLSAPVFRSKPVREFEGHTQDILDLSWSKNNFLLSSSMDKTVRLWHISRQECLCTFKHKDFVTSIAFHPKDDRFFLAGSLDSVLRLWSIPDKSVAFWNQLPDLITAVAFSPDGKTAMAGVLSGLCLFYETEGLKYHTQIHVRSSRGKNAKGSKITGIRTIIYPPNDPEGETKVLITSNDSRVRVYNLRDKSLEMKFRGHENTCSQINASFSDDAQYVICGSEDRKAYIWSLGPTDSENKDKRPCEFFEAHSEVVTAAIMAPTKSRVLLSSSGDPLYDLCNPPPVTLLSRDELNMPQTPRLPSETGEPTVESHIKRPEESPAYLARCSHNDGNIIITADYYGRIKVFRQDCAFKNRRNDIWETGSTFSKKVLGRSNSIMTRNSAGSHSRRTSISQSSIAGVSTQSDHILNWRNAITNERPKTSASHTKAPAFNSRNDRSVSPGKFTRGTYSSSSANIASTARQLQYGGTIPNTGTTTTISSGYGYGSGNAPSSISTSSPPRSLFKAPTINTTPSQPPPPSFTLNRVATSKLSPQSPERDPSTEDIHRLDTSGKYQFWNIGNWKNSANTSDPNKLGGDLARPGTSRNGSVVSKLSSEGTETDLEAESDGSGSDQMVACRKCGGKDFRAKKVSGRGQMLVCGKCGTVSE